MLTISSWLGDMERTVSKSSLNILTRTTPKSGSPGIIPVTNGTPVSFMDLSVIIRENRLIHELYRKPSDSGVNLNFDSQIPNGVKMAVATEQFRRANELSSSPNACKRSLDKVKLLLADNSFPEYAIEDALHRCEGLEKGRH